MRNNKPNIPSCVIMAVMLLSIMSCVQSDLLLPENTPDPCSEENIQKKIGEIKKLVSEFDDIKFVANLTQREQLTGPILELQRIRRQVEYLELPSCLNFLRSVAVQYMDSVILYLAYFMGGSSNELVNDEINNSQNFRITYEKEFASLLGIDYVLPATVTPLPLPPSSTGTNVLEQTDTEEGESILAFNHGSQQVNIRVGPYLDAVVIGYLQPEESVVVVGRTESSDWIAIILPGVEEASIGWIYAEIITLNVPIETLPISVQTPTLTP